ncbi:MAG: 50S ribosomal protein L15 [Chloroflexota bacterium]|nr:50S ribosomal protein L15 [Chloroflexota bacterium]
MKLHDLKPNEGATKRRKRVGRGISAGQGKTAGRGTKGQNARTGGGVPLWHEGGNVPLFRRLPQKRGFTPPNRVVYNEVNLFQLEGFDEGAQVSPETLAEANLLKNELNPVVILGHGDIDFSLEVRVHRVSSGARAKIEAAGGSVEILD